MVRLDAFKENGNIVITEDCFEHLLNCLDNQTYIDYETSKNQVYVDDFNRQCRNFWCSEDNATGSFKKEIKLKQLKLKKEIKLEKLKEQIPHYSIMWLEVKNASRM